MNHDSTPVLDEKSITEGSGSGRTPIGPPNEVRIGTLPPVPEDGYPLPVTSGHTSRLGWSSPGLESEFG